MDVIVQVVRTSWTKRSRGGLEAARRNAAPIGFVLPTTRAPLVHEVFIEEVVGFEPRGLIRSELAASELVQLRLEDGLLRVQCPVTPWGMPRRWRRPPAVRLALGGWLRWQVNYRFAGSCGGDWSYRLDTVNVAHGPVVLDVFLGVPTRHVDERAGLR
ncbi:MAG TPA: hypothetical protein VEX37_08915 [Thermomicrobiales bacterium]|nr:hypothetical protein [Thermomicrobiales bacterium]